MMTDGTATRLYFHITVSCNQGRIKIQFFSHPQAEALSEENLAFCRAGVRAFRPDGDGGIDYGRAIQQLGNEPAVIVK